MIATAIEKPTMAAPGHLPAGTELQQVAYLVAPPDKADVVVAFPPAIGRWAALVAEELDVQAPVPAGRLLILSIPVANQDEADLLSNVREWVDALASAGDPKSQMMTLQGAQLFWTPGRVAVLAQPGRLTMIRNALVEAFYYESELRDIERQLGESWPQFERDLPLAFEFDERAVNKRQQLLERFRQVLLLRARLARIAPFIHSPHLHPPTLASQVEERFRERMRVTHRHEFLSEQIEVFEKVYESCGQRASDYMLNRSSNTLEWVIIVLLLLQVLLYGFELITAMGP